MKTKQKIFNYYGATLTAIVAVTIATGIFLKYTRMDYLEILAVNSMFVFLPAFLLPLAILEDPTNEDDD